MSLIQYPNVQGVRVDPSSVGMKLGVPLSLPIFFVSVTWKRTRTRTKLQLNHPDPVGKTRGKNEYDATLELGLAEANLVINKLGAGYGDIFFPITLNIRESGFDQYVVYISGCTLDEDDGEAAGTNPLTRKFNLNPLKITVNGLDDLSVPLVGVPQ